MHVLLVLLMLAYVDVGVSVSLSLSVLLVLMSSVLELVVMLLVTNCRRSRATRGPTVVCMAVHIWRVSNRGSVYSV